jgi:UBA/TS-N domain
MSVLSRLINRANGSRSGAPAEISSSIFTRARPPPEADPAAVEGLKDMGFPEERVKRVLVHFRNNVNTAMDYLICTPENEDAATIGSNSGVIGNPGSIQSTA